MKQMAKSVGEEAKLHAISVSEMITLLHSGEDKTTLPGIETSDHPSSLLRKHKRIHPFATVGPLTLGAAVA
jgi:hypothetical protein